MQILVLRGFSLAISGCPSTDFCKRQTELKNRPKKSHLSCTLMRELELRAPTSTLRAIIGVQGARARACAARPPRLQLQLAPMTSFVTSFPRRYRDVI